MRRALALVAVVLATSAAACGSDDDNGVTLPSNRRTVIAAPFVDGLEELGLRITRAALVDPETGEPGPGQTHLAVYVEPTGAYTADDFATGLVTSARVFLPSAFERWPGLTSFDVCQEPLPSVDATRTPPPKTQIAVSREEAEDFDWAGADLEQMLARAASQDDESFRVYVDEEVASSGTFQRDLPAGLDNVPSEGITY